MVVLNLLKFWRNAAGGNVDIRNRAPETDEEPNDEEDSFFDLVLTGPNCDFKEVAVTEDDSMASVNIKSLENENDNVKQYLHKNSTNKLSKRDGQGQTKSNHYTGDVFSIRKIMPIETNSKPHSPVSPLRSPPKFRIFMLGFKTSSSCAGNKTEYNCTNSVAREQTNSMAREQTKCFSMRYTEDQIAPSMFRDNSLRSKMERESSENSSPANQSFRRDIGVQKYLKMMKPLYARASLKIRILDQSTPTTPVSVNSPRKQAEEKQGSRTAVFREMFRNFVKSRSAVGLVPAPARRRDDSALQQQDGIQSAILHCKRSYSSSSSSECTMLSRSASDSSYQRAFNTPRNSTEE